MSSLHGSHCKVPLGSACRGRSVDADGDVKTVPAYGLTAPRFVHAAYFPSVVPLSTVDHLIGHEGAEERNDVRFLDQTSKSENTGRRWLNQTAMSCSDSDMAMSCSDHSSDSDGDSDDIGGGNNLRCRRGLRSRTDDDSDDDSGVSDGSSDSDYNG